jgi:hypothetical protein
VTQVQVQKKARSGPDKQRRPGNVEEVRELMVAPPDIASECDETLDALLAQLEALKMEAQSKDLEISQLKEVRLHTIYSRILMEASLLLM